MRGAVRPCSFVAYPRPYLNLNTVESGARSITAAGAGMPSSSALLRCLRPWRVVAALLVALTLFMMQADQAHAAASHDPAFEDPRGASRAVGARDGRSDSRAGERPRARSGHGDVHRLPEPRGTCRHGTRRRIHADGWRDDVRVGRDGCPPPPSALRWLRPHERGRGARAPRAHLEVQREHGFAVDLRHMAIRGQCASCQHESETRS